MANWVAKTWQVCRVFLIEDIWPSSRAGKRTSMADWGKFISVVARGFMQNRCHVRAAALSYNTLLAIVPLMAVILGVSKAMLAQREELLFEYFLKAISNIVPQINEATAEQQLQMREKLHEAIGAVNAGALGLIGTFMLAVTGIALLSAIERTMNDIWGVTRGRSPMAKVSHYWTTLTFGSIVIFVAMGLTGSMEAPAVVQMLGGRGVITTLGTLAPYVVLWLGFTMLYAMMPNTHVQFRAALIGGVVAGTLWQLNNSLSFIYVFRVVSANKLYGSLGLIPVFLFGLYVSWLIVLLGAQVAYTLHNAKVLAREKDEDGTPPNQASKEQIALRLMLAIARQFHQGKPPLSASDISLKIGVPLGVVNQIIKRLVTAGLVLETTDKKTDAYTPAHPLDQITAYDVLRALRELDGRALQTAPDDDGKMIQGIVSDLHQRALAPAKDLNFLKLIGEGDK